MTRNTPAQQRTRIQGTTRTKNGAFVGLSTAWVGSRVVAVEIASAPVTLTVQFSGVYQIGDVYARSCSFIGTSSAMSIPNTLASKAVQRGVGISITRT